MQAIFPAIEGTDTFIFVLSPDSVTSEICGRELAHAVSHNKRMIPIMARDVEAKAVPEPLAKLNWVFARDADSFEAATDFLISALDTDLGWVRAHTRLLTRAIEWEAKVKSNSFVLRGEDLRAAEQWLAQAGTEKERQPTALQTEYIIASRKASARRQRITVGALALGLLVSIVLALVAFQQRTQAVANAEAAETSAKEAGRQRDAALKAEGEATLQRNSAIEALSRSYFSQGTRLVAERQSARALAFFAAAVRNNGHRPSAARMATLLTDRVWARPLATQRVEGASRAFFSANGAYVVAVFPDSSAEIREGDSGKPLSKRIAYHLGVSTAYFAPDGEHVVITTGEGKDETKAARSFQLWQCKTGQPIGPLFSCAAKIYEVSFSADSRRFALCADDATYLCNARGSTPVRKLEAARTGRFSADASRLVTGGTEDGSAQVWDAQTGRTVGKRISDQNEGRISVAALSPDGMRVATGLGTDVETGAVRVWEVDTGKALTAWLEQNYDVDNVLFSRDGRWLLSICRSMAQVFDSFDGKSVTAPLVHPTGAQIKGGSFRLDGARVSTVGVDGSVCVWDSDTGELAVEMWEQPALDTVAFSDECRAVFTTSDAGKVRRTWNILTGIAQAQPTAPLDEERKPTPPESGDDTGNASGLKLTEPKRGGVSKTPDGRHSVMVGIDGSVQICDAVSGESQLQLANLPEDVTSAEFSPDGTRVLVSATKDNRELVGLWDAAHGGPRSASLRADPDFAGGGFSPDSRRLVIAGEGTLHILDPNTGKEIVPPPPMAGAVRTVSFTSDARLFATAGDELQIWNALSGQPLINAIKAPPERGFSKVAFNHDGARFVASTSGGHHEGDHTSSQVFDTATGVPLTDPHERGAQGGEAFFSPDGRSIIEGVSHDQQWDAPPEDPPPTWLASLGEAFAGQRLNESGVLELADSARAFEDVRRELAEQGRDESWIKIAQWILAEASVRTISPFSAMKVSELIERGLGSEDDEALESALRAAPENAVVHARLGLRWLKREDEYGARAKARADQETFLATKLDVTAPEVWKARAAVLKALKRLPEAADADAKAAEVVKPGH
jgi:WD40 repeat protein